MLWLRRSRRQPRLDPQRGIMSTETYGPQGPTYPDGTGSSPVLYLVSGSQAQTSVGHQNSEFTDGPPEDTLPDSEALIRELNELAEYLIQVMGRERATAVVARKLIGMTNRQVAEHQGVPVNTATTRNARGMRMLGEAINRENEATAATDKPRALRLVTDGDHEPSAESTDQRRRVGGLLLEAVASYREAEPVTAVVIPLRRRSTQNKPNPETKATSKRRTAKVVESRMEEGDAVGAYLHSVRRTSLLTAKQEVELAKEIEAGVFADQVLADYEDTLSLQEVVFKIGATLEDLNALSQRGREARNLFAESNVRLVISIAKGLAVRYRLSLEDTIQDGNAGLMHAIDRFDYTKGYKFSTYATWWIRKEILYRSEIARFPVHLAAGQIGDLGKLRRAQGQLGPDASLEDLVNATDLPEDKVNDAITLNRFLSLVVSFDEPVPGSEEPSLVGDLEPDNGELPDEAATILVMQRDVQRIMTDNLTDQQLTSIQLYFGVAEGVYKDVGQLMGISRERASQLVKRAIEKLSSPKVAEKLRVAFGNIS
jgi:RNA polymerase nonessential primary-like sigma factor